MKVLLKKTFIKMFKPVPVLVSVLISGALGFVLSRVYLNLFNQNTSYSNLALNIEIIYMYIEIITLFFNLFVSLSLKRYINTNKFKIMKE